MTRPFLEGTDVARSFGGLRVLTAVSFAVAEGEIVALIGPNGAGKTTLFNLISGLLRPSAGSIRLGEHRISALPAYRIARLGSGPISDPRARSSTYPAENVAAAALWSERPGGTPAELLALVEMAEHATVPARRLTGGRRKLLELAMALALRPRIILLDELLAGLTPTEGARATAILRNIRDERGVGLFWVEHVMKAIMETAGRLIVLHHGEVICEGLPRQSRAMPGSRGVSRRSTPCQDHDHDHANVSPQTAAAGTATVPLWRGRARAQAKPVRIGYTLSATGPYAVGAGITQAPNYTLWQEQVNAKGGLAVKGEGRRMVEFLTIDDRSEIETAVRFYEKLATDDKVDLLLPPWGSAMNFAIAPVAGKYGYPMIGPTAISGKFKELAQQLPYFYTILVQPAPQMQAVAALLRDLRDQGKIKKVAVAYVNDLFGIELNAATGPAFKAAGLEVVDTKSYPLGAKDLSPVLKGFKDAGADAFVGLTYPPDNILVTTQAKEVDWNPAVFFTGVGTAFPFYRDRFKGAEGVMGIAGWNPKVKFAGAKEYFDAHVKKHQKEPDRWASAFVYASLQILERCVGEVGLDRPKIKAMLDATEFQTVAGPIKFAKGENVTPPGIVGQWQKNEFELVWPKASSTGTAVVPKPAWA